MRHRCAGNRLGRTTSHRIAMMKNMANSVVLHERIVTTTAKDHITWRNHYPAGESRDGALRVLRFPVARISRTISRPLLSPRFRSTRTNPDSDRPRATRALALVSAWDTSNPRSSSHDASEVRNGMECGIAIANYSDIKVGDVIEAFVTERIAAEVIA